MKINKKSILRAAPRIVGQSIWIIDLSSKDERIVWGLNNFGWKEGVGTYSMKDNGVTMLITVEVTGDNDGELVSIWIAWSGELTRFRYDQFRRVPGGAPVHLIRGKRQRSSEDLPNAPLPIPTVDEVEMANIRKNRAKEAETPA